MCVCVCVLASVAVAAGVVFVEPIDARSVISGG